MANELYGKGMASGDDGDEMDVDEDSLKESLGKRLCQAIEKKDYAGVAEAASKLAQLGSE